MSLRELKELMARKYYPEAEEIVLRLDGIEFTDPRKKLCELGLERGQMIEVTYRYSDSPVPIVIETEAGKRLNIEVNPNDTWVKLKEKLKSLEGIPVNEQVLKY